MSRYFRREEMFSGEILCPNCGKKLIEEIAGLFNLKQRCPRCKCQFTITTEEPIPYVEDRMKEISSPSRDKAFIEGELKEVGEKNLQEMMK